MLIMENCNFLQNGEYQNSETEYFCSFIKQIHVQYVIDWSDEEIFS